jgi:hypothetical protein
VNSTLDGARWSAERAHAWYNARPLPFGCNFIPSNAINALEMWQAETFDPKTIDRELGFAQNVGMNAMRVYLHNLLWEQDAAGLKRRMEEYLTLAAGRGIDTLFVLFDTCWNDHPQLGEQPAPRPGVHNSGWVQGPGSVRLLDPSAWGPLEGYTRDILSTFGTDSRVLGWDLFNEPTNGGYSDSVLPFLVNTFAWARMANPSQPLTVGTWDDHPLSNDVILQQSDIITFHNYDTAELLDAKIVQLQALGRPIICTEYMARTVGSRFETCLPVLLKHGVGAINWGLVKGKTNTIFGWEKPLADVDEPPEWFHDIFRPDGTPFNEAEVACLRAHSGFFQRQRPQ